MKKIQSLFLPVFLLMSVSVIYSQGPAVVALSANSGNLSGSPDRNGRPAPDSRGWTDPALNHNILLQSQTSEGMYKLVGPYKVVGSSFLYGEQLAGDMFAPEAKAYNIYLSYNTYNQEVEFFSTSNPDKSLVREPGTLDSFSIKANADLGFMENLKFIYGKHLAAKDKAFFQEMYKGTKYSLYKKYKSELGYVSSNIANSELRQFDLSYDYYYFDAAKGSLKKLKNGYANFIREFKDVKDLSAVVADADYITNPEAVLRKGFAFLNQ